NTSASVRLSHELAGGAEVFGTLLHSEGESEFDATQKDWYEFTHHASSIGIRGNLTEQWLSTLKVAYSIDESERFGGIRSKFNTERNLLDWQNDLSIGERHLLTLGADYQNDRVNVSDDYLERSRDNVGIYGQWQTNLDRHDLALSLRRDDNEAFGRETTGQIAWGVRLNQDWDFYAAYGTAFKAATFNELYTPFVDFSQFGFPGSYVGNPDLRPEVSETYELGITFESGMLYLDAALFETQVDDLIVNAGGIDRRPENINDARIRGVEVNLMLRNNLWTAAAAVTHLQHEDRNTGKKLNRRPDSSLRLDLDRHWNAYSIGSTFMAEGSRYDDVDNQDRLGGFALLDLRASYRITPEWRLSGKIQNALDKDYETIQGFNQPGRAFFVTLNYQQR
ncbi:TonB-dependent receptor domain-containing protein, partial [Ectothiorhodospira lacustris]|uniref:TonB-dependent receptor domain-containing protein n=1 Tax=Ectothiorhodospira lacustris TaxID=2899127 RepID=UPI001EE90E08